MQVQPSRHPHGTVVNPIIKARKDLLEIFKGLEHLIKPIKPEKWHVH